MFSRFPVDHSSLFHRIRYSFRVRPRVLDLRLLPVSRVMVSVMPFRSLTYILLVGGTHLVSIVPKTVVFNRNHIW